MDDLETAGSWLARSRATVVLTGAGISTESGIPDFRGPQGVWTKDPGAERMATLQAYLADPELRRRSWLNRLSSPAWTAEPNPAHRALVDLDPVALVTQNVDGLHQRAGSDPARVFELHGTMHRTICWECHDRRPMAEAVTRVRAGADDPPCLRCGGVLKSDTILFGQDLDPEVLRRATEAAQGADVFVALGTSLAVYPAAGLVPIAKRGGARLVIANAQPTPYDDVADVVFRDPLGQIVPALVASYRECRPSR